MYRKLIAWLKQSINCAACCTPSVVITGTLLIFIDRVLTTSGKVVTMNLSKQEMQVPVRHVVLLVNIVSVFERFGNVLTHGIPQGLHEVMNTLWRVMYNIVAEPMNLRLCILTCSLLFH